MSHMIRTMNVRLSNLKMPNVFFRYFARNNMTDAVSNQLKQFQIKWTLGSILTLALFFLLMPVSISPIFTFYMIYSI